MKDPQKKGPGSIYRRPLIQSKYCRHFCRLGQCPKTNKGGCCRYVHDRDRVSLCANQLLNGECDDNRCNWSHTIKPEIQPYCTYFQRAQCKRPDCRFAHVHIDSNADICRLFARNGYCSNGYNCYEQHILLCPFYATYGVCRLSYCNLPHKVLKRPPKKTIKQQMALKSNSRGKEVANEVTDISIMPVVPSPLVAGLLPDFAAMQRIVKASSNTVNEDGEENDNEDEDEDEQKQYAEFEILGLENVKESDTEDGEEDEDGEEEDISTSELDTNTTGKQKQTDDAMLMQDVVRSSPLFDKVSTSSHTTADNNAKDVFQSEDSHIPLE
ncbi:hypothetical protein BDF19DRAFT_443141 [Syncephalis fuscata]|nr:hypothetical protein BDF19DRAFT_443141 [Syncephalis fuscata]